MNKVRNMRRKLFTLNEICISFIENIAKEKQVSQSEALRRIIQNFVEKQEEGAKVRKRNRG